MSDVEEIKLVFLFDYLRELPPEESVFTLNFSPNYTNNTKTALETEAQPSQIREEEMLPPTKGT